MAGDLAAAQQKQAVNSIGYYNLKVGPTAWRFSSGLTTEFNDNVRLQPKAESDLIFRPNLDTQIHWPITLKNSLDVSLGVGYSEYLQHQDLNRYFISPGSGFSFDVYSGDFRINLHDRLTISENTYENAGGSGNRNVANLENTLGTGVLWDLNKAIVNLGFDHVNHTALSSTQGQPGATSENLSLSGGIRARPELLIGLETGGSLINYQQTSQSNVLVIPSAMQWNAGVFGSATVSEYINLRLDAGYTIFTPGNSTTNLLLRDSSGIYLALTLSHRVNQWLNYSLTAGRSTDMSAYGQVQTYNYVRLQPNWNVLKKYSLSTPISWRQGTRVYNTLGSGGADYQQIVLGLNLGRRLTQKLTGSIAYQYIEETSGLTSLNFTADIVSLNLNYQF